jgi:hypothetical protein
MKEHNCHTITVANLSVGEFEINALSDGGVHLAFDLTHGLGSVDLGSMDGIGGKVKGSGPVRKLAHPSHIVTQVSPKLILVHVTLVIIQPRQSEHHIEEVHLPCIQHHDIIVASDDLLVEVVFQLNSSATNVVWQ